MQCPKCNGDMYDNTVNKKNPKGPDYKCKNKDCKDEKGYGTGVWVKKAGAPPMVGTPTLPKPPTPDAIRVLQSIDKNLAELLRLVQMKNEPLEKEYNDLLGGEQAPPGFPND